MELQEELRRLAANGARKAVRLLCANCSQKIDCSEAAPFAAFSCPACGVELVVPVTLGDYQLCCLLHKSRKAAVYMAQDCTLDREVALKIPVDPGDNEYYRQCFSALAQNAHPGLLWVYKFSAIGDLCCGSLQYMDLGGCRNARDLRLRFGCSWVLDKLLPVASALVQLAEKGKTHRDICPANFLCSSAGEIRLTNLHPGRENEWEDTPRHWRYQAPESLCTMEFSSAADIYSFSLSIYELLCSVYPFKEVSSPDDLMELVHIQHPVPLSKLNPQIPEALSEVVTAGMDPAPACRPSPRELVRSMRKAMAEIMERELS